MKIGFIAVLLALLALPFALGGWRSTAREFTLASVQQNIEKKYSGVRHIDGGALANIIPDEVILFDVRKPQEYAVSHLSGAIHINPRMKADAFMASFGDKLSGKTVVFYCSVGERSSKLAEEAQSAITAAGAKEVYNLRGGIFAWHNAGRPVFRQNEETRDIHPFNRKWGKLVEDKSTLTKKS